MPDTATIQVVMPQMGDSVSEGTILEWHKAPGDAVGADETIVEISTDKVDAEVAAPVAGTIVAIHGAEGDTIAVGALLAEIAPGDAAAPHDAARPGDGAASDDPPATPARPVSAVRRRSPTPPDRTTADGTDGTDGRDRPAAPSGRPGLAGRPAVAAAEGIDLDRVTGRSGDGRITKADVLAAVRGEDGNGRPAGGAAATLTGAAAAKSTPLRGSAAQLARYMDESRSVPTATSFRTITVTVLDGRRGELKAAGRKVSFTHLVAYAIARAASDIPVMAHHYAEVEGKPQRIDDGAVNLGLAVDVERRDGSRALMVPVIADAGRRSFAEFLAAYGELVEKARTNALSADDMVGANLTLTNPGGLGTVASVPRLMVGQGTIVATGAIAYPVGLGAVAKAIGAEKVMSMTSTYDHRIIQGAESGRFLGRIEAYLQGEHSFYEEVFASLGLALGPCRRRPWPPPPPPRQGRRPPRRARPRIPRARSSSRPSRRRSRCSRPTGPTGTWPRAWTRWAASRRATRRSTRRRST